MNMKWLITASTLTIFSVSAARAADVTIHHQPVSAYSTYTAVTPTTPIIIVPPTFSWTGFYLGGQIGGILGKTNMNVADKESGTLFGKDFFPKLSGFVGGVYAGSNIDLGNGLILGVDTDIAWVNKSDIETVKAEKIVGDQMPPLMVERLDKVEAKVEEEIIKPNNKKVNSFTFKEKWAGATRIRIGFAANRVLPYIAGGIAYTQIQGIESISVTEKKDIDQIVASGRQFNETKWLVGYTLGGGIDFSVIDNVIVRAEYRYSDFGKKKFVDGKYKATHKTNGFHVGVAYKF
ncbi:outer membrane protein [Bartonella sp. B17]